MELFDDYIRLSGQAVYNRDISYDKGGFDSRCTYDGLYPNSVGFVVIAKESICVLQ